MPTTLVKVTLMLALAAAALSGCRSGSAATEPTPGSTDEETSWFCQEDGNSGEWYCTQDDELARNPEKTRAR